VILKDTDTFGLGVEVHVPSHGQSFVATSKRKADNSLTVFRNVFKKDDDKTPHYRGKLRIEGKEYECGLWINSEVGGVPIHLSGTIQKPGGSSS